MSNTTDNAVAADLLEDYGFRDQARILRKLNEIDINRSCELAQNRYDYEEFLQCIIGIFEDCDLFRCKLAIIDVDTRELANDWMLD